MDTSEQNVHEGTKTLQELADEVERERQERGRSRIDTETPDAAELFKGTGASNRSAYSGDEVQDQVAGDPVPVTDDDAPSPNAALFGQIQQQNGPTH